MEPADIMGAMRATRVIYVENDPALCGIMATLLRQSPELHLTLACSDPGEAITSPEVARADVALLDLALGPGVMNGVDLGLALREINPEIGIVLHSQYPLDFATDRVPPDQLFGWSTMKKSADLDIDAVVVLLRETARGVGTRERGDDSVSRDGVLDRLTARQRAIMGMVAAGLSARQVADRLGENQEAVRQELTRAYRILVPDEAEGDDRRTQAVLTYVRLTREEHWDAP
jgi:DNA-binding NarL/FixJ family response regulator